MTKSAAWDRYEQSIANGEITAETFLSALADSVRRLAFAGTGVAEKTEATNAQLRQMLKETSETLDIVASTLSMHALSHHGDTPFRVTPDQAAMVLAPARGVAL